MISQFEGRLGQLTWWGFRGHTSDLKGMSTSYIKDTELNHQKGKKTDLARNTRKMKKEGYRRHSLRIKCKTTTSLATLIRKWPWTAVAQLRFQCKACWYVLNEARILGMWSQPSKCRIQIHLSWIYKTRKRSGVGETKKECKKRKKGREFIHSWNILLGLDPRINTCVFL